MSCWGTAKDVSNRLRRILSHSNEEQDFIDALDQDVSYRIDRRLVCRAFLFAADFRESGDGDRAGCRRKAVDHGAQAVQVHVVYRGAGAGVWALALARGWHRARAGMDSRQGRRGAVAGDLSRVLRRAAADLRARREPALAQVVSDVQ